MRLRSILQKERNATVLGTEGMCLLLYNTYFPLKNCFMLVMSYVPRGDLM